jgi:hypothetical protein
METNSVLPTTETKPQSPKSKKLAGFEDFERYQDVIDILNELRLSTWSKALKASMIAAKVRSAKFEKIQTND